MKRSMILLAAVFAMASTSVFAQNTSADKADAAVAKSMLSDAELDNITAGSAMVVTVVFNNGNASIEPTIGNHFQCINCADFPLPGVTKLVGVVNPARTVIHCVGSGCF